MEQIKLGALRPEEVETDPASARARDDIDNDASDEATPGLTPGREVAQPVMIRSPSPRTS
jgi:hypothetical protein